MRRTKAPRNQTCCWSEVRRSRWAPGDTKPGQRHTHKPQKGFLLREKQRGVRKLRGGDNIPISVPYKSEFSRSQKRGHIGGEEGRSGGRVKKAGGGKREEK